MKLNMKVLTLLAVLLAATVSSAKLKKITIPPNFKGIKFSSQGEQIHLEIQTNGKCQFNVHSIEVITYGECKFTTSKQKNKSEDQQPLTKIIQASNSDAESIDIQYDISSKSKMFKVGLIWPGPKPDGQCVVFYPSETGLLLIDDDRIEVAPDSSATYLCLRLVNTTPRPIRSSMPQYDLSL